MDNDRKRGGKMDIPESCVNCGTPLKFVVKEDENGMPEKATGTIQCDKCKKYMKANIDGLNVKLELIDEIQLTVLGMREIADDIEKGNFELLSSKHEMVMRKGVGKKPPEMTNMRMLTVVYADKETEVQEHVENSLE